MRQLNVQSSFVPVSHNPKSRDSFEAFTPAAYYWSRNAVEILNPRPNVPWEEFILRDFVL